MTEVAFPDPNKLNLPIAVPKRLGLLAGWGDYPIELAKHLHAGGCEVICIGFRGHTNPAIGQYCKAFKLAGLCRFHSHLSFFGKHNVALATMAGKIFKSRLLDLASVFRHLPDLVCIRHFFQHFISGTKNRNDDSLLGAVTTLYARYGITMLPATDFAPQLLANDGVITSRSISSYHWKDIAYGWQIAKEMGRLDIGQSVVVKGRTVLAIEAIEGTDECIRRAGQLSPAGHFVVVKVAKPQQDMRFDVPTVGLGTIQTMRAVNAKVLAIESQKTILLNRQEVISYADKAGISIVAVDDVSLRNQAAA